MNKISNKPHEQCYPIVNILCMVLGREKNNLELAKDVGKDDESDEDDDLDEWR